MWRDEHFSRLEEFAALLVEQQGAWGQALWEIAARPHLKNPPEKLERPGVIEVPRPGEVPPAASERRGAAAENRVVTSAVEIKAFFG